MWLQPVGSCKRVLARRYRLEMSCKVKIVVVSNSGPGSCLAADCDVLLERLLACWYTRGPGSKPSGRSPAAGAPAGLQVRLDTDGSLADNGKVWDCS